MRLALPSPYSESTPEGSPRRAALARNESGPVLASQRGGVPGEADSRRGEASLGFSTNSHDRYCARSSDGIRGLVISGRGAMSYQPLVDSGLALGLSDPHDQVWAFRGPDGTAWRLAGCDIKQLWATRCVVQAMCDGNFTSPDVETSLWPVVGNNRGVYFAAQNKSWANVTTHAFYRCLVDHSDAHYAGENFHLGDLVGAALLVYGAYTAVGHLVRGWAPQRNP